jgi:hypothetical protein
MTDDPKSPSRYDSRRLLNLSTKISNFLEMAMTFQNGRDMTAFPTAIGPAAMLSPSSQLLGGCQALIGPTS